MSAYYNEIDPFAAQWLRNLISAGHISAGDVDERSIVDVQPSDLAGYTQCHFFAGIGGWSLALRLAGWPDDRPVWTGSCPCQDFSAAGKGAGFAGERHLWPVWFPLIRECRPRVVFGEQVASPLALSWLDLVQADMEGADYAFAALDLCAAGVGAPHIRQRLGFVADAELSAEPRQRPVGGAALREQDAARPSGSSLAGGLDRNSGDAGVLQGHTLAADSGLADAVSAGWTEGWTIAGDGSASGRSSDGGLADATGEQCERRQSRSSTQPQSTFGGHDSPGFVADAGRLGGEPDRLDMGEPARGAEGEGDQRQRLWPDTRDGGNVGNRPGPLHGGWRDADWLLCRDGRWRPVEPGTFPLAHGVPGRVGRLRAYGNAIVPALWAELIGAYLDVARAA